METYLKAVPNIDGLFISPDGEVVYHNDKVLKVYRKKSGSDMYRRKVVYVEWTYYYIHNLVYLAYVHPIKHKRISFIDGNRDNTHYSNLSARPFMFDKNMNDFAQVKEYPDTYVNKFGSVVIQYGIDIPITICAPTNTNRYYYVSIFDLDGKSKSISIARLVALAFLPNSDSSKNIVMHKNGSTLDNHYLNLYWSKSNFNRFKYNNRTQFNSKVIPREQHPHIISLIDNNIQLKKIAIDFGVSDMTISRIKSFYKKTH